MLLVQITENSRNNFKRVSLRWSKDLNWRKFQFHSKMPGMNRHWQQLNFCNFGFKITIWGAAWNPSLHRKPLIIRWFSTDGLVHCLIFIIWDNPPSAYLDHPPVNINIPSPLYISDCQSIQTPGALVYFQMLHFFRQKSRQNCRNESRKCYNLLFLKISDWHLGIFEKCKLL